MRFKSTLLTATAYGLLLPAAPVMAQDTPVQDAGAQNQASVDSSDIIVTARRRQESILKVPVVATVLGAAMIEQAQITDLSGISSKVPGLRVSPSVSTIGNLITLRGIGTSALDAGVDQSTSLNIDGQQFSQGLTFRSGMFDLAQAEVLKGPQALFFGKNSPAGVIALTTADPQDFVEVIGRVSYEFEAREPRAELILSGPVSDTLGLRLAGSGNKNWIVRGTAAWQPTDRLRAKLKVNFTQDKSENPNGLQFYSCLSGPGPSVIGVPFIGGTHPCRLDDETEIVDLVPSAFPGVTNGGTPYLTIKQHFGVLSLDYDIADDIMASSTTSYYRNKTDSMIHGTYAGAAASLWADNHFTRRDITQEIRVESDYGDSPLNWMVGGYYQDARMTNDIVIGWNQALNAITGPLLDLVLPPILDQGTHDVRIESASLFGQLRWRPVEKVEIAGGVRWTDEQRTNDPTRFGAPVTIPSPKISSQNWSPELTITYTPTDDLTIFGALKQGYKSGSFQITTPNPQGEDRSFGDEKSKAASLA